MISGLTSAPIITNVNRVKIGEGFACGYDCVIGSRPLMTEFVGGRRVLIPALGNVEIGKNVTLGSGVRIVFSLNENEATRIGDNCLIWHNCVIGHDCDIGANTIIGVGCNLSGIVKVGEWSYIAVGSTIAPRVKIGKYSMIGHGSNVRSDAEIPDSEIWVGNPAKYLKPNCWRPPT